MKHGKLELCQRFPESYRELPTVGLAMDFSRMEFIYQFLSGMKPSVHHDLETANLKKHTAAVATDGDEIDKNAANVIEQSSKWVRVGGRIGQLSAIGLEPTAPCNKLLVAGPTLHLINRRRYVTGNMGVSALSYCPSKSFIDSFIVKIFERSGGHRSSSTRADRQAAVGSFLQDALSWTHEEPEKCAKAFGSSKRVRALSLLCQHAPAIPDCGFLRAPDISRFSANYHQN